VNASPSANDGRVIVYVDPVWVAVTVTACGADAASLAVMGIRWTTKRTPFGAAKGNVNDTGTLIAAGAVGSVDAQSRFNPCTHVALRPINAYTLLLELSRVAYTPKVGCELTDLTFVVARRAAES
jgi:hypothetical protein